jgi:hypothetical protein
MEKEEKKRDGQNNGYCKKEDSTTEEFEFVNDFFTSEVKSEFNKTTLIKEKKQEERKKEFKNFDQSVTFFLPDFFTHDD